MTGKPSQALSGFFGEAPAGTWELTVTDSALDDIGTLHSWGLNFELACACFDAASYNMVVGATGTEVSMTSTQPTAIMIGGSIVINLQLLDDIEEDGSITCTSSSSKLSLTGAPLTVTAISGSEIASDSGSWMNTGTYQSGITVTAASGVTSATDALEVTCMGDGTTLSAAPVTLYFMVLFEDKCNPNPCGANATCNNLASGGHTCTCNAGYEGDGQTCSKIAACLAPPTISKSDNTAYYTTRDMWGNTFDVTVSETDLPDPNCAVKSFVGRATLTHVDPDDFWAVEFWAPSDGPQINVINRPMWNRIDGVSFTFSDTFTDDLPYYTPSAGSSHKVKRGLTAGFYMKPARGTWQLSVAHFSSSGPVLNTPYDITATGINHGWGFDMELICPCASGVTFFVDKDGNELASVSSISPTPISGGTFVEIFPKLDLPLFFDGSISCESPDPLLVISPASLALSDRKDEDERLTDSSLWKNGGIYQNGFTITAGRVMEDSLAIPVVCAGDSTNVSGASVALYFQVKYVDECDANPCPSGAACTSGGLSGYTCTCSEGYLLTESACEDIDECQANPCDPNASCSNSAPGFLCSCNQGYSGDGFTCIDIDECFMEPCGENATCTSTMGSYMCNCDSGYAAA